MSGAGCKPMLETSYRASRWFRVLANPAAYQVFMRLGVAGEPTSVSDLAAATGQTMKTLSHTLRQLRQVDLVRYETRGRNRVYWVKDREVVEVVRRFEALVDRMRGQEW